MKLAVIGFSGAGKSTLARWLGDFYGVEVLHIDRIHWLPGWETRPREERNRLVEEFLDTHDAWVIDGNYTGVCYERRMAEADRIIFLKFGRLNCLRRAFRRSRAWRGRSRDSMTEGCEEKMDPEFIRWILWEGRRSRETEPVRRMMSRYPEKFVVLRNQRDLDRFRERLASQNDRRREDFHRWP